MIRDGLRCHVLDREDDIKMYSQSIRWAEDKISKLLIKIEEANLEYEKELAKLAHLEKSKSFVESTLGIHWINDPGKYIQENWK